MTGSALMEKCGKRMIDRTKVIKGLDEHTNLHKDCEDCPYNGQLFCQSVLIDDALKLLKEQQETIASLQGTIRKLNAALEEQPEQKHGHWIITGEPPIMIKTCSECNIRIFHHPNCELEKFCAWCGAKMDKKR